MRNPSNIKEGRKVSKHAKLLGKKFGRLTVVKKLDSRNYHVHWLCECVCGNFAEVSTGRLNAGQTKSCGCLQKERAAEAKKTHGLYFDENGKRSKLYRVWGHMNERCSSPTSNAYEDYGGRGIRVCKEWKDYKTFHEWAISNGYKEGLSIERVDNDGNYEPSNCKWIPISKQASNRRNIRYLTLNGRERSLLEWSEEFGLDPSNVRTRLKRGWSVERALTTPDDYRRSKK